MLIGPTLVPSLPGWIAALAAATAVATWLVRRYALARALLDQPGERRSHSVATPRGGGAAIVLVALAAIACVALRMPLSRPLLMPASAGLVLVAAIGWIDDHRPLSPWSRLVVHALAAVLLGWGCLRAGMPVTAASAVSLLAVILVNVWNFMDGIDGLAASQAGLVATTYALAAGTDTPAGWLCWAVAAACAGFLPFNFPRARIFLGDVGSGALGYLLALLIALGTAADASVRAAWQLLPLSAFLLDAALTLGSRMVRGERWWTPHVSHLYQRLARAWNSHVRVTCAYGGWTLLAASVGWFMREQGVASIMCAVLAVYLAGVTFWWRTRTREAVRETA